MIQQLQLLLLLLAILIQPQAVNGLILQPPPVHHVPRRLRQTRLFTSSDRATAPLLANDYYGNPLGPKAEGHMRILLQNPNKISAQNDFVDFQYICQRMLAHDVDIFGLSETGIDWKQGYPRNRCVNIMKDFWPHSRLVGSTSDTLSETVVQYGGTCTAVTGKWTGRIESSGSDPHGMGRWSYVRLNGKNGRRVTSLPSIKFALTNQSTQLALKRHTCNNGIFSDRRASRIPTLGNPSAKISTHF